MGIPAAKELKPDDVRELLALEREDIDMELIRSYFGCFLGKTAPRFNTYDKFKLPAGRLYNKQDENTTIGRYLCNLVMLPEAYLKKFGYENKPFKKGVVEDMEKRMANMILNDELSTKEYAEYLDNGEWIGMGTAYFLAPTMNYDINVPIPEVIELRDQLFEKYKKEIAEGQNAVAEKIEREVLDLATKKLKESGNEAYDFFESGVGKFANNYKKTSIMAGAIQNPYTGKLDILKSNYIDGVDKNEYAKFANLTLIGGYSRGVETQSSGYERKKIDNALQAITLGEKDSDCKTTFGLKIAIPAKMKNLFLDRYILNQDGSLLLLSATNIDEYVDKEVILRSPLFCKSDCICNKCAGEFFYKMGITNAGLLTNTMARCSNECQHEEVP